MIGPMPPDPPPAGQPRSAPTADEVESRTDTDDPSRCPPSPPSGGVPAGVLQGVPPRPALIQVPRRMSLVEMFRITGAVVAADGRPRVSPRSGTLRVSGIPVPRGQPSPCATRHARCGCPGHFRSGRRTGFLAYESTVTRHRGERGDAAIGHNTGDNHTAQPPPRPRAATPKPKHDCCVCFLPATRRASASRSIRSPALRLWSSAATIRIRVPPRRQLSPSRHTRPPWVPGSRARYGRKQW